MSYFFVYARHMLAKVKSNIMEYIKRQNFVLYITYDKTLLGIFFD